MSLRRTVVGSRRFHVERVIGVRTAVRIAVLSLVVTATLTADRPPALLDGPLTAGAVLDALPVALLLLVVLGVGVVLVFLGTVRERQYLPFGGRRGHQGAHDPGPYDDSGAGGLFESFGGVGNVDGDGGGGGGGGEGAVGEEPDRPRSHRSPDLRP